MTDFAAARRMMVDGQVRTAAGDLPVHADTICIHGDGPHAVPFAKGIRERLEVEGVRIVSFGIA